MSNRIRSDLSPTKPTAPFSVENPDASNVFVFCQPADGEIVLQAEEAPYRGRRDARESLRDRLPRSGIVGLNAEQARQLARALSEMADTLDQRGRRNASNVVNLKRR